MEFSNRLRWICDGSMAQRSAVEREFYLDAYRWVMSDDCSWPFSFLNVCQTLNLAPETVREEVLGDLSLGRFRLLDTTLRTRRTQISNLS